MTRRFINNELERNGNEEIIAEFKVLPRHLYEGPRKTLKNLSL
jgi:hypothetical protein